MKTARFKLLVAGPIRFRRIYLSVGLTHSRYPQRPLIWLGIDVIAYTIYDTLHHRDLESWRGFFRDGASRTSTAEVTLAGLRCVFTVDPQNIKAILATQFTDFGKGPRFHDDWKSFLGDSIFTTDGEIWHASRRLIRPQFVTERVSDLEVFERHVQILMGIMTQKEFGGNGPSTRSDNLQMEMRKAIDVSDFFLRYTLDTAAEFLLGASVNSLENPRQDFTKAFAEVQRVQNLITRSGCVDWFLSLQYRI